VHNAACLPLQALSSKSSWHPQMPHPRCLSMALTSSGPCMSMSLVAIDPLFPFQPRSVIVSHLVILHSLDIFHSFLAHLIPFHPEMRQTRQHVLNHGPCRPANHACGEALGSPLPSTGFFGVNRNLLALSLYRNNQFLLFTLCTYLANDWCSEVSWHVRLRSRSDFTRRWSRRSHG
jgi:hypothetical protein